jgi:hypothetical protein
MSLKDQSAVNIVKDRSACLLLQGLAVKEEPKKLLNVNKAQYGPLKGQYLYTNLHGVTS